MKGGEGNSLLSLQGAGHFRPVGVHAGYKRMKMKQLAAGLEAERENIRRLVGAGERQNFDRVVGLPTGACVTVVTSRARIG